MNKKWEICKVDKEQVEKLQENYKINRLLATLLVNREITTEEKITKFLNPKNKI